MTLYRDKKHGGYVEVDDDQADPIQFYPQGGGMGYRGPRAKFMEEFERAEMPATHHRINVTMDHLWDRADFAAPGEEVKLPAFYPAYTNDSRWNGWVMPYFTLETARAMIEAEGWGDTMPYDAELDAFIDKSSGYEEEAWPVKGEILQTVDGPLKLYGIGAGAWVWWEVTDEEVKAAQTNPDN